MKTYEVRLRSGWETDLLWIKTDGKIVIPEDSCLFGLKEIDVSKDASGIDLIVEENSHV